MTAELGLEENQQRSVSDRDGAPFDSGWPEFRQGILYGRRCGSSSDWALVFGIRADRPLPAGVHQLVPNGHRLFFDLDADKVPSDTIEVKQLRTAVQGAPWILLRLTLCLVAAPTFGVCFWRDASLACTKSTWSPMGAEMVVGISISERNILVMMFTIYI
eukprot:SAG31_NODE_3577_length_4103_cov_2.362637_2_plen_160_part_00